MKKSILLILSAITLLFASPCQTQAFIPPAEKILEPLLTKNLNTLEAQMETIIYEDRYENGNIKVQEQIFMKKGGLFRSERSSYDIEETIIQQGRRSYAIGSTREDVDARRIDCVLPMILFQNSLDEIVNTLNLLGVNTWKTSLDRINQKVSYVIGDHDQNNPGSRLWIERERRIPLRFEGTAISEGKRIKLRAEYTDYTLMLKHFWYPRKIHVYKDDILWIESTATTINVNRQLPENLFAIPRGIKPGHPITDFLNIEE
jgi:outer membrane lipoprotein-sorting protein